jgi:3-hydroxyisobutyrate dehydrogenase-like beta-hydroxyacid dehydrogenase
MAKIAWIGLGVMGYPMAGHLLKKVKEHGAGRTAKTPAEAAAEAEFVFSCVGNDNDVRSITLAKDGAFHGMPKGAVFIDNTTASATVARELYTTAKERGFDFLDAPVSGGQAGAQNGTLSVMVGGDAATFERAKPIMTHYARAVTLIGPAGAGQLTKMVNQICIAGLVQGLAEGLHFAQKAGLIMPAVMEAISKGAAGSWQMENRWKTMTEGKFDFGFAVNWMRKDLMMSLDEAHRNGASLPVAALVDQFYAEVQWMGGGRWDTSSLIARLNRADGR